VLGTIETITPTFVLPRQGEGVKALPPVGFFMSRPRARPKIERTRSTKGSNIYLRLVIFVHKNSTIICFDNSGYCSFNGVIGSSGKYRRIDSRIGKIPASLAFDHHSELILRPAASPRIGCT
jgi:hypothetical protein